MPVGSYMEGYHGVSDVCLSVPTIVGKNGIEARPQMDLSDGEIESLKKAETALKNVINSLD